MLSAQKTAGSAAALDPAAVAPSAAPSAAESSAAESSAADRVADPVADPVADSVADPVAARAVAAALDRLGVGWCLHGSDGRLLHANDLGRRLLGAAMPTEAGGVVDLSGAPLRPQDHPVAVALRTGLSVGGVVLGVGLGTPRARWVRVDSTVVDPRDAGSGGVATLIVDVTEETERSRESAEAAERATRLMEPVADVICRLDAGARFLDVTRSVTRVLGHEPEDLFGRTLAGLAHVEGAAELTRAVDEARAGREGHAVVRCRRRDGELRWTDIVVRRVEPGPESGPGSGTAGELHAVLRDVHERVLSEQARQESDWRYRLLADNAGDVVLVHDASGLIRYASPSTLTQLGHQPGELAGRPVTDLIHPDDVGAVTALLAELAAPGAGARTSRQRIRRRDGGWLWVETAWRPVADDAGSFVEIHATSHDVSDRVAGDQALAAAEESFRLAFDSAAHGMARLSPDGRLQRVNDVLAAMVGRSRAELEGLQLRDLAHPDDADPVALLQEALRREVDGPQHRDRRRTQLRRDQRLVRADGSTAWVDLTLTAVRDAGSRVRHLVAQLVDTTAERVLAEQLRGLDLHDPLTTAATAELLRDRLDAVLADPRRRAVALMRVDLDAFRRLNDARGHVAADRVLVTTVQRLRAHAREGDLVARLGGDDFALLCVGLDHAHAERLAQKVSRGLSGAVGGVGPVTVSIGVATARDGDEAADVLNRAEAALSVVKSSGGAGWAVD